MANNRFDPARLDEQLAELARRDALRSRRVLDGPQGPRISIDGRDYLAFCSNDYLGLANHPRINAAAIEAIKQFGVGAGASPMVTGHNVLHQRVEERLAHFVGLPRALLFASGYQANIGAITSLVGRGDAVFSDALNHASLIDGMRLSRAEVTRYPHGDVEFLAKALSASRSPTKLVASDAVFSMDGDVAPLTEILALCERFDAWLLLDDAHGFGVLGEAGRGALEHFKLASPRIVYVGTLGKAAGVSGAFVAGPDAVVETVLQRARTYMFSTASPAMLAAAVEESLLVMRDEPWRRTHLRALIHAYQSAAQARGLHRDETSLSASDTPIQPLVVGANAAALSLAAQLRERGILVPAIRPPTVPEGTARLRISLSAAHSLDEVEKLVAALADLSLFAAKQ
ncbi:MAG: 8-amino-7-oxononanoate synthase [Burkholderiales bacterium]